MSQKRDEDGGAEVEVEEGRSRRGDSIRTRLVRAAALI